MKNMAKNTEKTHKYRAHAVVNFTKKKSVESLMPSGIEFI